MAANGRYPWEIYGDAICGSLRRDENLGPLHAGQNARISEGDAGPRGNEEASTPRVSIDLRGRIFEGRTLG